MSRKLKHLGAALMLSMACLNSYADTDLTFDVSMTYYGGNYDSYLGQAVNVTLSNLTLNGGEWRGVCFPFTATTEQLNTTFGEGKWQLRTFTELDGDTIRTAEATSVAPATPYAIYVEDSMSDPTFSGVTLASTISSTSFYKSLDEDEALKAYGNYLYVRMSDMCSYGQDSVYVVSSSGKLVSIKTLNYWDESRSSYVWFDYGKNTTKLRLDIDKSGYEYDEDTMQGMIERRYQLSEGVPTLYLTIADVADDGSDLNDVVYKSDGVADYHDAAMLMIGANNDTIDYELPVINYDAETGEPTDTTYYLEMKVRGNSTASSEKKPYRMKFAKKHKHDMLGYGYNKRNWTLLANAYEGSHIRNALTYHLGEALGMPFNAGYRFVDVVINNSYRGTYQISDHIEADADRVNVDEDTGWMFEFVSQDRFLDDYYINESNYPKTNIKNPDGDDYVDETTGEMNDEWNALLDNMKTFIGNWNSGFNTYSGINWRDYNDEETLIKFYLVSNLSGDYDGFFSIKAYKEADDPYLFWGPIWDKDLAYGNCTHGPAVDKMVESVQNGSYYTIFTDKLNSDAQFVAHTKMVLDKVINDGLESMLLDKVESISNSIAGSWQLNYDKWGNDLITYGGISTYSSYTTQSEHVSQLKEWISDRITNVKSTIDSEYETVGSPDTTVSITIGNGGWSSFSYPLTLDFSQTGAKVYIGTLDSDSSHVVPVEITDGIVPACTAILIKGTTGNTITPTLVTDWVDRMTGNDLIGSYPGSFSVTESYTTYALSTKNGVTGFYPVKANATMPQYKAYITLTSTSTASAKTMLTFEDITTGITETVTDTSDTINAPIYNTMGVRVDNSYKGIVIQNGKKYIAK